MGILRLLLRCVVLLSAFMPASAQWLNYRTPGMPRTADGKPNLSGKWEGDTLVVDSSGFNDQTWLDDGGHPHTEALHVSERFRRRDFGHMDLQLIVEDPKAYTKPWGAKLTLNFLPDDELLENICENEKDFVHIVGK